MSASFRIICAAMIEELSKIAGFSSPAIVAPPTPGGDSGMPSIGAKPPTPITPTKLIGKVVSRTNLQKTNYTKPNTSVVSDNPVAAEQKGLTPPAVRS